MKKILIGTAQTIVLDQTGIPENKDILLSIVGEDGSHLTDSEGDELKNLPLSYNSTTSKYQVATIINSSTAPQYIRLYFSSAHYTIENNYFPEDAKLESRAATYNVEIVPASYFEEFFIALSSRLDPNYKAAFTAYIEDKESIRTALNAAIFDLETEIEVGIVEQEMFEQRDNFFDRFNMHLWQMQLTRPPINELVEVKIKFGQNIITGDLKSHFVIDKMTGIIEFLPLPAGGTEDYYSILLNNVSGMAMSLLYGGVFERIPNMFQVTYKTGIFTNGADPREKDSIRRAICRRAFMDISKVVDPTTRAGSESESIDGVSSSINYRSLDVFKEMKEDEKEFVDRMRKKYAKGVDMVVI